MHTWLQDFRYACRMLRKNIILTVVMVASLAIGIGANAAIFSVVDALLLRSLSYPQPERLTRSVHRSSERKPFLRADGSRAKPHFHIDRPGSAGTR